MTFEYSVGVNECVVGRNQAKLDQIAKRLVDAGLKASAEVTDIKDADAVDRLFNRLWSTNGRFDMLIKSAGGQFPQPAIDFSVRVGMQWLTPT